MLRRIRDLREDKNLTQEQIGAVLNISQVAYSYYEIGKRELPIQTLNKLADFYKTSTDYILERTNEIKPYPRKK